MLYVSKLSSLIKQNIVGLKEQLWQKKKKWTLRTDFSGLGRKSYSAHDKLTTQVSHIHWYGMQEREVNCVKSRPAIYEPNIK